MHSNLHAKFGKMRLLVAQSFVSPGCPCTLVGEEEQQPCLLAAPLTACPAALMGQRGSLPQNARLEILCITSAADSSIGRFILLFAAQHRNAKSLRGILPTSLLQFRCCSAGLQDTHQCSPPTQDLLLSPCHIPCLRLLP